MRILCGSQAVSHQVSTWVAGFSSVCVLAAAIFMPTLICVSPWTVCPSVLTLAWLAHVQVQRGIDGCCKQLMTTLGEHKAACQAFDAAVVWQAPGSNAGSPVQQQRHRRTASAETPSGGGRSGRSSWSGSNAGVAAGAAVLRPRFRTAPTQDPWCTEGKLVAEQQALKRWQVCASMFPVACANSVQLMPSDTTGFLGWRSLSAALWVAFADAGGGCARAQCMSSTTNRLDLHIAAHAR